jgi:murein L,D-transpeptidase YcbB/YkuD
MRSIFVRLIVCSFLISGILNSCNDTVKQESVVEIEAFNQAKLPEFIKNTVSIFSRDTFHKHYFDTLISFYAANKYKAYWFPISKDEAFIQQLSDIADSAIYEGLKPRHYFRDSIIELSKRIETQNPPQVYQSIAELDLYISNFLLGIWHDKVMGRTNPKEVLGMKYTLPYPNHPWFNLFDALDKKDGVQKVANYQPSHPDFFKLKQLLYSAYATTEGSETLIDTTGIRKLVRGDSSYIVPLLAKRLVELGYAPDTVISIYANEIVFDRKLSAYLKDFQKEANLTDDGIVGKSTLKLLNASHNDKIDEIRANIERSKWFGEEPEKPYVMVNIPEFMLYMIYRDSVKSCQVCVGKGKERYYDQKKKKYVVSNSYFDKPLNHETPQIYSNIDYVVLNPTWTVPSSIVGREMYSQIVRDPGYLIKHNYQVLKNGEVIDPYSINWRKLKPGNIPYTIRQNSGDDNSLGRIKFTFRNPFSVYMHDTPLKRKFKLNNRAVSHGCVRVESPIDLTGFVLQDNKRNTYDDVRIMIGLSPTDSLEARLWREDTTSYKKIVNTTKPIRIENKMVVLFDYKTIVFDEFNKPRFIFDTYDKNALIIEAMNKW